MTDTPSDKAGLFINAFQRETKMERVFNVSRPVGFTLRGSRRAIDEVIACQRPYFAAPSSQSDPFATLKSGKSDRIAG